MNNIEIIALFDTNVRASSYSLLICGGFSISFCFLAFIYGFCYFVNERFFLCCCDAILNIEFSAQFKERIKEQTTIAFCVQVLLLQIFFHSF